MKGIWIIAVAYIISGSAYAISVHDTITSVSVSEPLVMLLIGTGLIVLSILGRKKMM